MTSDKKNKSRPQKHHTYLHGNFAPIQKALPLTPCAYHGTIPPELAGGEYVRNGGNPVSNEDLGRDAHWFDGDGMLSGVAFSKDPSGEIQPQFVNQFVLTDAYLATISTPSLRRPILPSIATLVNPASSLVTIILRILRTIFLVIISHLSGSEQAIKKISVANTAILYHDGRALATCESGPPMRVSLPGLESVGWFDGLKAEGEPAAEKIQGEVFGGDGLLSFMKDWTTAHPRVDPVTKELILYHVTFFAPFVHYSILPDAQRSTASVAPQKLVNAAVPGVKSPKMMHDFGVSLAHTVIMDLPLSLDPRNLARNQPIVSYDPSGRSRFGVFPRWHPEEVRWFETNACCIFHTGNTWDDVSPTTGQTTAVNMLASRLTSASLVFSAGDIAAPVPKRLTVEQEEEQCRLYYYKFDMTSASDGRNHIKHQFSLSVLPFEFPSLKDDVSMTAAKYVYGCSLSDRTFGAALGRGVKIDSLVKMNVEVLIARGLANPPAPITGCVDTRSAAEVLASDDKDDPIQIFNLPAGWYAQECRFVPCANAKSEDDGWIMFYAFDESQLDAADNAPMDAKSELWIVDAKDMTTVVARVVLPQRVPYGLHGSWFSELEIKNQRPIESLRQLPTPPVKNADSPAWLAGRSVWMDLWMDVRQWMLDAVG
ncbi:MAG: hypothetical protein M1818_004822 [Claussenomyces sp. TS43310]|nr:MAG: hypothetical protein M1818_004822 [Claussenomyces sp. TS43310]